MHILAHSQVQRHAMMKDDNGKQLLRAAGFRLAQFQSEDRPAGLNTMAVKDGSGPRPAAQTATNVAFWSGCRLAPNLDFACPAGF